MENRIITEDGMVIYCAHSKMVEVDSLIPNPKNPNVHPQSQIDLLAKIMVHQGVRSPITVSLRSGFIICGHGRLEAIKKNNWKWAPVDYQNYESEALEYAAMVSDNKIAELAEIDLSRVNADFLEFGPDFDTQLLGMLDFKIEPADFKLPNEKEFDENIETTNECPSCHYRW